MPELINGRVEDVKLASTQRSLRVRIGNAWYGAFLPKKDDEDIQSAIGKMVVFEYEDKGKGAWITRWRVSQDQTLPAGARPITPHQGAAQVPSGAGKEQPASEPARQLSAEELKVVNGIVMGMVQHWNFGDTENNFASVLMQIQTAMKAIAQTVREL